MKPVQWPTFAALACACVLATGCDRRDSSVPPPSPQATTPGSPSTSGGMGSTAPGDATSAPGMGASTPGTGASN